MIGMDRKHFKRSCASACLFNIIPYGIILQTIKTITFLNKKYLWKYYNKLINISYCKNLQEKNF